MLLGLEAGMGTRAAGSILIPGRGAPASWFTRIESAALEASPGKKLVYASLEELQKGLARLLAGCRKVAMQYSPRNAIPYISMVDAGTVEMVRACGCRVVSSADLVQKLSAS